MHILCLRNFSLRPSILQENEQIRILHNVTVFLKIVDRGEKCLKSRLFFLHNIVIEIIKKISKILLDNLVPNIKFSIKKYDLKNLNIYTYTAKFINIKNLDFIEG